jgi:uncharacterized protein
VRVVLDSNIIIAAAATRGLCFSLFELCLLDHQIIFSKHLLGEVNRGLSKIMVPKDRIDEAISILKNNTLMAMPKKLPKNVCRDPKDVNVLGLAVAAEADYIITGDQDLLCLEEFQSIPIVTPRHFWTILTKRSK